MLLDLAKRVRRRIIWQSKMAAVPIAVSALHALERAIGRASKVGDTPFFEVARFPWIDELERGWPLMRKELDVVLRDRAGIPNFQDILPSIATLSTDDSWKSYFLYAHGHRADSNCHACPQSARLVEGVPGMTTAFFSILEPGKHLDPHRGAYKGLLRYHLALQIPADSEACGIQVADETRHWVEGRSLVFDDTFLHHAWNASDEVRVVLFMDVKRPLPRPLSWINNAVVLLSKHSELVREIERNLEKRSGDGVGVAR